MADAARTTETSALRETTAPNPDEVEQLIDAAWAVAARTGSIEPSVREILQQAGLSTKAFYRHFRSKDDLLLVAMDRGTRLLVEYLEHRIARHDEPSARVGAWIDGFVRQAINPVAARRTLPWSLGVGRLAALFPEAFEQSQQRIIAPLEREIRAARASGASSSPDPGRDARLIFGYSIDTIRHHLILDTVPDAATVAHLGDFANRALGLEASRG
jgi:AcrR family transcriptional regulator